MPTEGFRNRKLGKLPPKNTPSIRFRDIYRPKVALPPHPPVDYLGSLSNWNMLGNNQYGDCVAVMAANITRLMTATIGVTEYYPSLQEVLALYKTQNPNFPNDDNGMVIQTMLEWWTKNDWGGRRLLAFARVDENNLDEMRAAISVIGTCGYGFLVQQHNEAEFDRGAFWTYKPGDVTVGGHAVAGGAHVDRVEKDQGFVTWAQQTFFAESLEFNSVDEFWVLIFKEHLGNKQFMKNIDVGVLKQAYEDLTHRTFPTITPPGGGCSWLKGLLKR